jgi:hypothetical protein
VTCTAGGSARRSLIWQNFEGRDETVLLDRRSDADPDRLRFPARRTARYPFLWNASIQNRTQWPGFAANGNNLLGLARNTGEVMGVFAEFYPSVDRNSALGIDYSTNNSSNIEGLWALEGLIEKIGPPKYQWLVDAALAKKGEEIFG